MAVIPHMAAPREGDRRWSAWGETRTVALSRRVPPARGSSGSSIAPDVARSYLNGAAPLPVGRPPWPIPFLDAAAGDPMPTVPPHRIRLSITIAGLVAIAALGACGRTRELDDA